MILIPEITLPTGEVYEDAYGSIDLNGTNANLSLWSDRVLTDPIRWTPLTIYTIVPGQEEQETVDALAAIGIPSSIV